VDTSKLTPEACAERILKDTTAHASSVRLRAPARQRRRHAV